MINEKWKTCGRFQRYEVSSLGRIRRRITGRVINKHINKRVGRYFVVLVDRPPNKPRTQWHTTTVLSAPLICRAFHGPRPKGLQTNHIDQNKLNDRASNLEWTTQNKNIQMSYNKSKRLASRHKIFHTQKEYTRIFRLHKHGLSQVKIGRIMGMNNSTISKILNHKIFCRWYKVYSPSNRKFVWRKWLRRPS